MFSSLFQSHNAHDLKVLISPIFVLINALVSVFITSEITERISSEFDEINDMISEFDWYLFPLKMQKMLPLIMMSAQQTVEFEIFGSFYWNRVAFKKVTNKTTRQVSAQDYISAFVLFYRQVVHCGFSYFMILRRFG